LFRNRVGGFLEEWAGGLEQRGAAQGLDSRRRA
jgi:hypothetical protein